MQHIDSKRRLQLHQSVIICEFDHKHRLITVPPHIHENRIQIGPLEGKTRSFFLQQQRQSNYSKYLTLFKNCWCPCRSRTAEQREAVTQEADKKWPVPDLMGV